MKRTALNVKKIEAIKEPGRYLDGWGLYLQVEAAKKRSTKAGCSDTSVTVVSAQWGWAAIVC
jgi:hypothetical protein